jgi:hypothetical protein
MSPPVSVVIPIARGDDEWRELVSTLRLPKGSEILLCCGGQKLITDTISTHDGVMLKTVEGGQGRAGQMNAGSNASQHSWIWFLHADSRFLDDTVSAMETCIKSNKNALYFFDLKFRNDGPVAMWWNERAVALRAGWLKIPFGDQGFLIKQDLFNKLGQYREDLPYGEDHVFVWKARQSGVSILRSGSGLLTSSRKYAKGGWGRVTGRHVWLTIKQAYPELIKLIQIRFGKKIQ